MHHFKGKMDDVMVVLPDVGGVARARDLAQRIGAPLSLSTSAVENRAKSLK
jgi:ribose-phosphate pyrophosphokinase